MKLDDQFLVDVGLGSLSDDQKKEMIQDILSKLELEVGMKLAARMSEDQFNEFNNLIEQDNDDVSAAWLEKNFPDYRQVVADELARLKAEIQRDAPKILEAMGLAAPPADTPNVA